jgi:hypothetical protein
MVWCRELGNRTRVQDEHPEPETFGGADTVQECFGEPRVVGHHEDPLEKDRVQADPLVPVELVTAAGNT